MISATVVAVLSFLVLTGGWLLDIEALRTFVPSWTPMAPVTSLLMLLAGIGIVLFNRRPRVANVLLLLVFVLGATTLAQYLFDRSLGIGVLSAWLHRGPGGSELPAPDAAAAFMMIALAMACWRTRYRPLHDFADVVAAVIFVISIQVLIGYTYHLVLQDGATGFRQIAPHSTLLMLLLAFAAAAQRPTPGIVHAMRGDAHSSVLLRRLLPITLLLCLMVGGLTVLAVRDNVPITLPELVAWSVTAVVVVLALLLFVTSAELRRIEAVVAQRERELQAATATAEAASAAKSRFMRVMSHELRTPVTAMIGYADLIEAGVAGTLTQEMKNYMQRIRASGWHLAGLIDAVLFYAGDRLPARHPPVAPFDVNDLARDVVHMLASDARDKHLPLTVSTSDQPVQLLLDQRKVRQILINLLSNAIKFTEAGSIHVQVKTSDDYVSIAVTDTGIGMDPESLARIWEPFELVDSTHTRAHAGVGLGLALTRRLIDQLGARILVHSAPGAGTTFTVMLPTTETDDEEQLRLDGARVLVIDDEPTVRRIMTRALSRHGAVVGEADSGAAALQTLSRAEPYDVIVTDISMPGMTGIELAQLLYDRGDQTPVLFVTGADLDARDHANIEALGGALLHKPFDTSDLARAVQGLRQRQLIG